MLQQTQAERVEPFFRKFVKKFPDFQTLSRAGNRSVLLAWQGLGYNRRALYLLRAAKMVVREHHGKLPKEEALLRKLPGVGKGTAGALRAFAWNEPAVFIETNIRRAFIHFFFRGRKSVSDTELFPLIEAASDKRNSRRWYSALMDYGAMLGKTIENPNRKSVSVRSQGPFKGSRREMRGKILAYLLRFPKASPSEIAKNLGMPKAGVLGVLKTLKREGFGV